MEEFRQSPEELLKEIKEKEIEAMVASRTFKIVQNKQ